MAPRTFATRRLRVAGQFVEPPPADVARITAEAARLDDIFTTVTLPDRFGPFAPPLAGVPGSNFGTRSIFNGEPRAPHAGVDYRGAVGTPISAPGAGRIVLAEPLFFTGDTVIIDHGLGLYSLLAHLSRIDVAAGQTVERGERRGIAGGDRTCDRASSALDRSPGRRASRPPAAARPARSSTVRRGRRHRPAARRALRLTPATSVE